MKAIPLAQSRFVSSPNVAAARDAFRKDPRIRILLDVGGGDLGAGALQPGWEITSAKAECDLRPPAVRLKPTAKSILKYAASPMQTPLICDPSRI